MTSRSGLSTSGNSENLLRAFDEASRRGLLTIGFAGYQGGKMAEMGSIDYLFVAPSSSVHRIQEAQTTVYHILWELTLAELGRRRGGGPVTGRMLIAGVGNIFLGDDGFGTEVANRLATAGLPDWVRVADYGISGMHLAYDLAEGFETTILVDATPRGGNPGTVYVMELDPGTPGPRPRRRSRVGESPYLTVTACSLTLCSECLTCSAPMPGGCFWSAASRPAPRNGSG